MSPLHFHFNPPRFWPNIDWLLMFVAVALSLFGVIVIWGAASAEGGIGPLAGYARRQLNWTILGTAVMTFFAIIDYRWLARTAWLLYAIILVVLGMVLIHGQVIKGAQSWFVLSLGGFRLQFQPAEPAKFIVVLVLAGYLSKRMAYFRKFWHTFVPLIILAIPLGLIMKQPDLGTTVVFIPTTMVMFYVAGLRKRVFIFFFLAGVALCFAAYPHLKPYQKDRIKTYISPGEDALGRDYNVLQAQTALGSGGFFGKGWGRGTQTGLRFLPEYQTDFIFPTLSEQFGFTGCMIALSFYALLLFRMLYLAGRAEDLYGVIALCGFATIFMIHIILNIGMAVGLLPVTGLPLPFLSYGGSFMLSCYAMIGISVSIGIRREVREQTMWAA